MLILALGIFLAVVILRLWEHLTVLSILGIVVGMVALAAIAFLSNGNVSWGIVTPKLITFLAFTLLAGFTGFFIGQLLHTCLLYMQWDRGVSERFFEVYATVLMILTFYQKLETILDMLA